MLLWGDSKTGSYLDWITELVASVAAAGGHAKAHDPNLGRSGYTLALQKARIDADLAAMPASSLCTSALLNIGVNDVMTALPDEATWKTNYKYVIDAILAKYPRINVYVAYPWGRGRDANCATLKTWIDAIIADYAVGVYAGHDENVWLKGADDGATMTTDGIHYSAAGHTALAALWKTILGY